MNRTIAGITLMFLLLPAAAGAQQKASIELKSVSEVEMVTTNAKGGKEVKRINAAKAKIVPDDIVIFTTEYVNVDKKPVENVVVTNPVPAHTVYVDRSAEGIGTKIDFSVDSGKNYGTPDKLTVTTATGAQRPAAAPDYTHIRWTLGKPLAPGGKGSVSFRARIK
jgi:uncharacterized repeat protein (TIGR01451 family)